MIRMVHVRLANCKAEEFDAGDLPFGAGEPVIVESDKGLVLGKALSAPQNTEKRFILKSPRKVVRKATPEDLEQFEKNQQLEKDAFQFCLEKVKEKNLHMKLFRMRIEMRQIGVRDEAKMICGVGSCGRELCCAKFLNRFELVSVKMAKEQNIALNPTKISGICGRLMCCLAYEYPTYMELKKDLPRVGKHIVTRSGKGKVIRQNVLNQTITVQLEEGGEITIHVSEI